MDFKSHIMRAWDLMLKNIVILLIMTLVLFCIGAVTLGILAPVLTAGYMQSILSLVRTGREPRIQDLFSHMGLFFPLLAFGLACVVLAGIGFSLFTIPGIVVTLAIGFCCIYMMPLMTDRGLGLFDAINESYQMAIGGNVADHVVVVILFMGVTALGGSTLIGDPFHAAFGDAVSHVGLRGEDRRAGQSLTVAGVGTVVRRGLKALRICKCKISRK